METMTFNSEKDSYYCYQKQFNKLPIEKDFKIIIDLENTCIDWNNDLIEKISKTDEKYLWKELHLVNTCSQNFDKIYKSISKFFNKNGTIKLICDFKRVFCLKLVNPHLKINKTSLELVNNENIDEILEKLNKFLNEEECSHHKNIKYNHFIKTCDDIRINDKARQLLSTLKVMNVYIDDLREDKKIYDDNYWLIVEGSIYNVDVIVEFIKNQMQKCQIISIINSLINTEEIEEIKKLNILFVDISSCSFDVRFKPYENIYRSKLLNLPKLILHVHNIEYYENKLPVDVYNAHKLFFSLMNYYLTNS